MPVDSNSTTVVPAQVPYRQRNKADYAELNLNLKIILCGAFGADVVKVNKASAYNRVDALVDLDMFSIHIKVHRGFYEAYGYIPFLVRLNNKATGQSILLNIGSLDKLAASAGLLALELRNITGIVRALGPALTQLDKSIHSLSSVFSVVNGRVNHANLIKEVFKDPLEGFRRAFGAWDDQAGEENTDA